MKSGFMRLGQKLRNRGPKQRRGRQKQFFRSSAFETLEDRRMLAVNPLIIQEVEPNNTINQAQPIPIGTGAGQPRAAQITGIISSVSDLDHYRVTLRAGDIVSALVTGGANELSLIGPNGVELQGSQIDPGAPPSPAYPPGSPLLTGGNAAIAVVAPQDGNYTIFTAGATNPALTGGPVGGGVYNLQIELFRPVLESQPVGTRQILYLDFEGGMVPRNIFAPLVQGIARLSPLDTFLPNWGLDETHRNAVIDAVMATVHKQLGTDVRTFGNNGDYSLTGVPGQFDIDIRNSRDHADPWGQPNVSRIIVGGSGVAELLITPLILAQNQTVDVGNFVTEETGIVLLDLLSAPGTVATSLNGIPRNPTKTIIDVIGHGVGTGVSREAGRMFGAWAQNGTNLTLSIMDQRLPLPGGATLANSLGVGPDGIFGTADDIDVRFRQDVYATAIPAPANTTPRLFTGMQDPMNTVAFGLSTGKVGTTISGVKFSDLNGNGVRNTNEPGLAGFTIFADLNNNGVLDLGEPSTITDANGAYSLVVPPGTVRIAEVAQPGFRQTFPSTGTHTLTVTVNQNVTGINFGNQAIVPQAIGTKWMDVNGNGVRDPGEPGIAGVWIYLDLNNNGKIDLGEPATVTDANGNYALALPGPGTFTIREVLGPGFVQTFPGGSGGHTVTANGAEVVGRDFGNQAALDFGDAPNPYPVTLAQNGARHGILPGFQLGATVNPEADGVPKPDARAADNDGVTFSSGSLFAGMTNQIIVRVETGGHAPGMLQGWIDFNQDEDWDDPGEQVITNLTLGAGTHVINIPVPPDARIGNTFARFRYSHVAGLGVRGFAATGEVEDYQIQILENRPNPNPDLFEVLQDSEPNSLDVLANDFASSTGVLSISTAGSNGRSAQGGVVTVAPNAGSIFYTPRFGFFGADTFSYTVSDGAGRFGTTTVTVNVLSKFERPFAVDDSFHIPQGSSTQHTFRVLDNDIAGRSGPIGIVSVGQTLRGGTVSIVSGGQEIRYTPPNNFGSGRLGGTDQFTYTIADSANPANLSPATVTVHVTPGDSIDNLVNFIVQPTDMSGVPLGTNRAVQVGDSFKIRVLVDDLRSGSEARGVESAYMDLLYDALKVQVLDVQFGSLYPNGRNRDLTVPGIIDEVGAFAGFIDPGGAPVLLFEATVRATAPGQVQFKTDPADILPLHETILRERTQLTFDQIGYGFASVVIFGDGVGGPRAIDDSRTSSMNQSVAINVMANDSSGNAPFTELLSVGTATNGTVVIETNNTPNDRSDDFLRYTPNAGFTGTDQFTYTIGNGTGLTSTAQVTVHVMGETNNRLVDFILEAVDPATDLVLSQGQAIEAGKTFLLNTYVQDRRPLSPPEVGVFSAYMDLLYDAHLASVTASGTNPRGFNVNFGPLFLNQQSGSVPVPGFIDEIGAVTDNLSQSQTQSRVLLSTIEFTTSTTNTGLLTFRTDPADIPLTHDVLVFGLDHPLTPSQITFRELTLNVVTGQTFSAFTNPDNPYDVNGDGVVSPIDALFVINDLNRNGSRTLEVSGDGAEGESPIIYLDVNGDSQISPVDVLKIINFLNSGGAGEGEWNPWTADTVAIAPDVAASNDGSVATPLLPAAQEPTSLAPASAAGSLTVSNLASSNSLSAEQSEASSLTDGERGLDPLALSWAMPSPSDAAERVLALADDGFDALFSDEMAAEVFAAWDRDEVNQVPN